MLESRVITVPPDDGSLALIIELLKKFDPLFTANQSLMPLNSELILEAQKFLFNTAEYISRIWTQNCEKTIIGEQKLAAVVSTILKSFLHLAIAYGLKDSFKTVDHIVTVLEAFSKNLIHNLDSIYKILIQLMTYRKNFKESSDKPLNTYIAKTNTFLDYIRELDFENILKQGMIMRMMIIDEKGSPEVDINLSEGANKSYNIGYYKIICDLLKNISTVIFSKIKQPNDSEQAHTVLEDLWTFELLFLQRMHAHNENFIYTDREEKIKEYRAIIQKDIDAIQKEKNKTKAQKEAEIQAALAFIGETDTSKDKKKKAKDTKNHPSKPLKNTEIPMTIRERLPEVTPSPQINSSTPVKPTVKLPEFILLLMKNILDAGYLIYVFGGLAREPNNPEFHDIDIVTTLPPNLLSQFIPPACIKEGDFDKYLNGKYFSVRMNSTQVDVICVEGLDLKKFSEQLDITANTGVINSKGEITYLDRRAESDLKNGVVRIVNRNLSVDRLFTIILRAIAFSLSRTLLEEDKQFILMEFKVAQVKKLHRVPRVLDKLFLRGQGVLALERLIEFKLYEKLFGFSEILLNTPMASDKNKTYKSHLNEKLKMVDEKFCNTKNEIGQFTITVFDILPFFYRYEMESYKKALGYRFNYTICAEKIIKLNPLLSAFTRNAADALIRSMTDECKVVSTLGFYQPTFFQPPPLIPYIPTSCALHQNGLHLINTR